MSRQDGRHDEHLPTVLAHVIDIDADPEDVQHCNQTTVLGGGAGAVLARLNDIPHCRAEGRAPIPGNGPWSRRPFPPSHGC